MNFFLLTFLSVKIVLRILLKKKNEIKKILQTSAVDAADTFEMHASAKTVITKKTDSQLFISCFIISIFLFKGASIIRMMKHFLGTKVFHTGLQVGVCCFYKFCYNYYGHI